jgi:MYXO-CTERM domain-containing protein
VTQPYLFGTGDIVADSFTNYIRNTVYTDPGVTITGSSVSGDGRLLTVNFDGLTAGKKAIFNVDLDAADPGMFPFPDYRMVLLGAPQPGENPTPPGAFSATFTNSASPLPNTQTLSGEFEQMTETPTYHDLVIRPYNVMDKVEIITTGGEIPEPTGIVLALSGLGLLAVRRRRRAA